MGESARRPLSERERHDAGIMARWAAESGYQALRWSVPNDGVSCPGDRLIGFPVRHDGFDDQFDLIGRRRFRPESVICSLLRDPEGHRVTDVPEEEWWRPATPTSRRPLDPAGNEAVEVAFAAARPRRVRVRVAAVALGLAVPATTLGGVGLLAGGGQAEPPTPPVRAQAPLPQTPSVDEPPASSFWVPAARVELASVQRRLALLRDAEAAWAVVPAQHRRGVVPGSVAALQSVTADLVARRAELEEALAAAEALTGAYAEMATAQHRAAELSRSATVVDTPEASRAKRTVAQARQRVTAAGVRAKQAAVPVTEGPTVASAPAKVGALAEKVLALAADPPAARERRDRPQPLAVGRETAPEEDMGSRPEPDVGDDTGPDSGGNLEPPLVQEPVDAPRRVPAPVERLTAEDTEDSDDASATEPDPGLSLPEDDAPPPSDPEPPEQGPAPESAAGPGVDRAVEIGAACAERRGATAGGCLKEALSASPEARRSLEQQAQEMLDDPAREAVSEMETSGGWPAP